MAKKKSTGKKIEDRSVRSNMNALIGICACVVLILAIVIFVVNLILNLLEVSSKVVGILNLIKDIALGIVVCLSAYYYARSKKTEFKIVIYVCIGIYVVTAIAGGAIAISL